MSFFPDAQGFEVHSSQFISTANTNNNTYLSGPTGIDILREASAPEAAHEASARSYSPRCFPGTREQYIKDIVDRATPSLGDTPLPIYWMKGPAGVGKSAIAQTCAERLQSIGVLGASFFFSISGQRKSNKLFPSIAYQLSTAHPAYRDLVDRKIRNDKTLIDRAMRFQFKHLIDDPLRELEASGKGISRAVQVFVDGLDECEGIDAQCEIVQIVAAAASDGTFPLRWVFFSRSEPHIESIFSTTGVALYCYKVMLPISRDTDGEIELYLRNALDNVIQYRNPSAQTPWPSNEEIKIVVRGAGGLFIYASTVVRFVSRPDPLSPQKRLLAIIGVILERHSYIDTSANAPLADLDAFYTLILQRTPMDAFPSVHLLLALVCRTLDLGAMIIANLLGMSKDEFETTCHHVSAVIHLQGPGKEVELNPSIDTGLSYTQAGAPMEFIDHIFWYLGGQVNPHHKSFIDFLLDPARSGIYCVTEVSGALENQLAKIRRDYEQTFCWRGPELVLVPGVPSSATSLSYPYTNELINSIIKSWVYVMADDQHRRSFPPPQEARGSEANPEFRKWLYINNSLTGNDVYDHQVWGHFSRRRCFRRYSIDYIPRNDFPKSAITEFKLMVEWRGKVGIIQRYHPTLTSRIKNLLHDKSQKEVESSLYRMGHGTKAIFWYWEINHKLKSYREFRAIDLAEGQKGFREEDFNSWNWSGLDSDS